MDLEFWHQKWTKKELGFHEGHPNVFLVRHFSTLKLKIGARVFVPLCGKTRDISWLLSQGCRVAGAELHEEAVQELFAELDLQPEIDRRGDTLTYRGPDLDLFVGDIFELDADRLGPVQAVYDRAALVALPKEMRKRYTAHLKQVAVQAPWLLIHFPYDQRQMEGPPFAVSIEEVVEHYGDDYLITILESQPVKGGLKGRVEATEIIELLTPRS